MTGRKLYDLICDGWAENGEWVRKQDWNVLLPPSPLAWPFLSQAEKRAFTRAAARIKTARRK